MPQKAEEERQEAAEAGVRSSRSPRRWASLIKDRCKKLDSEWLKVGKQALELYEAEDAKGNPYNLVYSNTETLMPGLYSQVPTVSVDSRFAEKEKTPEGSVSGAAAETMNRAGSYWCDTNDGGWDNFDSVIQRAVSDVCVLGQGQVRIRIFDETANGGRRYIAFEHMQHDRFVWGFCKNWRSCPWVAFGHDLTKEDFEATYAEWIATHQLEWKNFTWPTERDGPGKDNSGENGRQASGNTLLVWEIHEPATGAILHICDALLDTPADGEASVEGGSFLLQEEALPLSYRFPCPEPLAFSRKRSDYMPIPQFAYYSEQYETLQVLAVRQARLADAIRVRGVFNNQVQEIEQLLGNDRDNALIPANNVAALLANGGLEKNIWMLPIKDIIDALAQVNAMIEVLKQTIFEISGISDIQRGASNPNETLGAQQIKDRWSTLRLKRMQNKVSAFCRDAIRIAAELASGTFEPEDWKSITQLPFPTGQEKTAAIAKLEQLAAAKANYDRAMQSIQALGAPEMPGNIVMANPTAPPGAAPLPPAPPSPNGAPPDTQAPSMPGGPLGPEGIGAPGSTPGPVGPPLPPEPPPPPLTLLKLVQTPSWDEIVDFLQNRFARQYRLDIETDSTVDIEATENKESVGEYLNGASQLMLSLQPMVEQGFLDFATAKTILQEVSKLYSFGRKIASALDSAKEPGQAAGPEGDETAREDQQNALKAKDAAQSAAHAAEIKGLQATQASAMLQKDTVIFKLQQQLAQLQTQLKTVQSQSQIKDAAVGLQDQARSATDDIAAREQELASRESGLQTSQQLGDLKAKNRDLQTKVSNKPKGPSK